MAGVVRGARGSGGATVGRHAIPPPKAGWRPREARRLRACSAVCPSLRLGGAPDGRRLSSGESDTSVLHHAASPWDNAVQVCHHVIEGMNFEN